MQNNAQDPEHLPGPSISSADLDAGPYTRTAAHRGLNRRALLRAGAGASPVLLSLASSPVLASRPTCTVASSFVSVATFKSRNPHVTSIQCSTQTADYWRHQAAVVPTPAALTVTVASLLGSSSSTFNAQLVKDVMLAPLPTTGTVQTTGELGTLQHLLALALNINAGFITAGGVFNLSYVQGIWSNYKTNGNRYKLPASNIDWGDSEIIAWLRFLMYPVVLP
jgi:hypothetical protein